MFSKSNKPSSKGSTPPRGSPAPRASPPRDSPRRASPSATPSRQTTPSREPTPPRLSPPRTSPPRETTPPAPAGSRAAVYVTVYEHTRRLFPGLPRTFMRHCGIVLQPDPNINDFQVYHVVGTPGVGLTYTVVKNWKNPMDETASLLAMDLVAWMPQQRVQELEALFRQVTPQVSRSWNCQNWVQEGLQKMVGAGLITDQQARSAVVKQSQAVNLPYEGNTPNRRALD